MGPKPEDVHGGERLLAFADAVVAIAITLLAIPLIELFGEATRGDEVSDFGVFLDDAGAPLLGFVISFFVIARMWWAHHRVFEHVERIDAALVRWIFGWLFSIVLLSAVTALTTATDPGHQQWRFVLYVSVMIVSGLLLLAQSVHVLRHPALTDGADTGALARTVASAETLVGFVLTLVVGTVFPVVNYLAFVLLALTGRLDGPILRRLEARRSRSRA